MTVSCTSHNSNGFNLSQFIVHWIKTYAHFHKGNQTEHCEKSVHISKWIHYTQLMCFKRLYVKKPQTNQLTNKTPNHHTLKIPENKQTGPTKITPMLVGHNAANNLFT